MWQLSFVGFFDVFRIAKSNKVILLQNVIDCYYKVRQLLQSVADFITKCIRDLKSDSYYKPRRNNRQSMSKIFLLFLIHFFVTEWIIGFGFVISGLSQPKRFS